ncbi:MAG TPA: hypothetical protein VF462_03535 [Micromonosporaceae bacterium]
MNTRRLTTTGVALVAALSLGLTGCNDGSTGGTAGPAASASSAAPKLEPREELSAAARKLSESTAKIDFGMTGFTGNGVVDPATKKLQMAMNVGVGNQAMKMDIRAVDQDFYLRLEGVPNLSGKWLHIDSSKLPAGSQLQRMRAGDPLGANNLMAGVTEVQRTGEGSLKGTLDLTKSPTADKDAMKMLGDKAKSVPFTAEIDEQGRLTELVIDMESVHAGLGQMKTTYSDFGVPVTVETPAASEVQEAPAELVKGFSK